MGGYHPSWRLVRDGKYICYEDIEMDDVVRMVGGLAGGMDQSDPSWYQNAPMQVAPELPVPPSVPDRSQLGKIVFNVDEVAKFVNSEMLLIVGKTVKECGYTRPWVVCPSGCGNWVWSNRVVANDGSIAPCARCGPAYRQEELEWFRRQPA